MTDVKHQTHTISLRFKSTSSPSFLMASNFMLFNYRTEKYFANVKINKRRNSFEVSRLRRG